MQRIRDAADQRNTSSRDFGTAHTEPWVAASSNPINDAIIGTFNDQQDGLGAKNPRLSRIVLARRLKPGISSRPTALALTSIKDSALYR